jgi:hypothetical protein
MIVVGRKLEMYSGDGEPVTVKPSEGETGSTGLQNKLN